MRLFQHKGLRRMRSSAVPRASCDALFSSNSQGVQLAMPTLQMRQKAQRG